MAKVLSAFNFYGGKSKMASLICDMLDYASTSVYIEPFAGGARTLLNKPRHEVEIYNDASAGLCAFMRIMGDTERSKELINRLYETEYSPEEFYRAVLLRNRTEDNYLDEFKRQANQYLKQLMAKYGTSELGALKSAISRNKVKEAYQSYQKIVDSGLLAADELAVLHGLKAQLENCVEVYRVHFIPAYKENLRQNYNSFKAESLRMIEEKIIAFSEKSKTADERGKVELEKKIAKMERVKLSIEAITFFTLDKKTKEKIRKASVKMAHDSAYTAMDNSRDDGYTELNENGTHVSVEADDMELAVATYIVYSQSRDGMGKVWSASKYKSTDDYQRQMSRLYDVAERLQGVQVSQAGALGYLLQCSYLNNDNVCFYLDPSYLDPAAEERNLGGTYKFSSDYEAHELLLKTIYKADAKILISNYDVPLYNKYLTEKNGWHKMEFQTTTSVGGVKDNQRTEILWWNY